MKTTMELYKRLNQEKCRLAPSNKAQFKLIESAIEKLYKDEVAAGHMYIYEQYDKESEKNDRSL